MYAKWIDGLLDVVEEEKAGYKPLTFTEAPDAPSGYEAASYWKETDAAWEQTWEIVPVDNDPDAEAADYEQALSELGVRIE